MANSVVLPGSSIWTHHNPFNNQDPPPQTEDESLSYENACALRFLANALAATGVLSFISTGPTPALADYRYLMDGTGAYDMIRCDQFIGCQNWVMSAILDVGILDRWKRGEEENGRLSLRELAVRAKAIEDALENGTRQLSSSSSSSPSEAVSTITGIYATATLTYLHTVVSGLNPALVEIQQSVSRTIELLKQLSDWHLVPSLTWPLCVTGCMASPDQESFFQSLVFLAGIGPQSLKNTWTVLRIMRDVWSAGDYPRSLASSWEQVIRIGKCPVLLV